MAEAVRQLTDGETPTLSQPQPPRPTSRTDWEWITPTKAEELLASAAKQRRAMPSHILYLANEIVRGWTHDNPQVIVVGESGDLLEGQHRLRAIVKAGRGIWLNVSRGVPDPTFEVLDTGRPRNPASVFSITYRELSAPTLSSAAILLWRYEHEEMTKNPPRQSPQVYKQFVKDKHPSLVRFVNHPRAITELLPAGVAAFCQYVFTALDAAAAERFFADLASGATERGTPARELRERLLSVRGRRAYMGSVDKCAWTLKAWNAFREGRTMQVVMWRPKSEGFPVAE